MGLPRNDRLIMGDRFLCKVRRWQLLKVVSLQLSNTLVLFLLALSNPLSVPLLQKLTSPSQLNPIQIENQLQGTRDWQLSNPALYDPKTFHYPVIEGYAWTTSAQAGDEVKFSVSTTSPSFSADVYRMGWYQGKGGRLIQSIPTIQGHAYPPPSPDASTGLIEARWPLAFTLKTDLHWVSGMYMVKLTASNGKQSYIPFVLRSSRPSGLAFIHAVNTDEAYNYWGGTSLYTDFTHTLKAMRAFKVSFDRPFEQDVGAGIFFLFEYPMVRWLEQHGYDVSYLSDLDIQSTSYSLQNYRALLIVGHSEYWSKQMRDALELAINKGVNLAVFAANTMAWQIRYEPRSSGSQPVPQRIIVCYKDKALDPLYGKENDLVTVQFRDDPLYRAEQELLGAMVGSWWNPSKGGFPWVIADASSWVFAGTALKNGDSLPGLVGYEYDKVYPNYPVAQGLQVLAASPVVDIYKKHDIANATLYTTTSGARVFNAGTMEWSWGLDSNSSIERQWSNGRSSSLVNRAAQKITANILQNFLSTHAPQDNALNMKVIILFSIVLLSLLYLVYWVGGLVVGMARPQGVSDQAGRPQPASRRTIWSIRFSRRTLLAGFAVAGAGSAWWIFSSSLRGPKFLLGTTLYTYHGHHGPVTAAACSPNGMRIASGSYDSTVQVWDAANGDHAFIYRHHRDVVSAVAWSPNGERIASASYDGTVQVWDASQASDASIGGHIFTYHGHSNAVRAVAWSPDGRYIACGSTDQTVAVVQVWDATRELPVCTCYLDNKEVSALTWSPNSSSIASASFDHKVLVWNVPSGKHILTHTGHSNAVRTVAWSPDGRSIASGGDDYETRVWDAATGATIYTYAEHHDHVNAVAWSPDGKRIASGSSDHTVQVWDAYTGSHVFTYGGHSGPVYTVVWLPDGQRITSGGGDSTVQVWQAI